MFKKKYATLEEVPAEVKHLYVKVEDGYEVIGAGQFKTVDDVSRVQEGLRKEREDHKATKAKLDAFAGLNPEEVHSQLDKIEEYKLAAEGKLNDEEINRIVETRLKSKTAPLERQLAQLTQANAQLTESVGQYETKEKSRKIQDAIRKAGVGSKVRDTALEDALTIGLNVFDLDESGNVVTKDGVGVTPGVEPSVWFSEVRSTRPHWWADSQGAGAQGGNGEQFSQNPFSADHWNMTEQSKMIQADRSRAEQMARSAGTTIGGPRPAK